MKGLITLIAVVVVVGLAFFLYRTPTAPPEMTEAEKAQIEADVMEFADSWLDAWRVEVNCDSNLPLMDPDRMAMPYDGKIINRDGWHEMCLMRSANVASATFNWINREVRVMTPDAAVFIGSYSSTWEYRDGSPAVHVPSSSTGGVVERTPDGWAWTFYSWSPGPGEEVEG
jgi:hypothetical protein